MTTSSPSSTYVLMSTWMASSVPFVSSICSRRLRSSAASVALRLDVLGIDGEAVFIETRSFRNSMTCGEQPIVFSLKSRRSLPARPPVGG